MKNTTLSILCFLWVTSSVAQFFDQTGPVAKCFEAALPKTAVAVAPEIKSIPLWESTFGTTTDWVLDHDTLDCSLNWTLGSNSCQGSFFIGDIQSTSSADGWALLDSDYYGETNGGNENEDSWLTTANPIDLTGFPNVVVEFETYYKRYNNEEPYLVVGIGDGMGNVSWPDLDQNSEISAMNNVFKVFNNLEFGGSTYNPKLVQINISPALTGSVNEVYFRLHWTGTYGFSWFVDDFKVLEQPINDVQLISGWIIGENNDGIEYSRIPFEQLDTNWYVGAEVHNFGSTNQTNIDLAVNFGAFNSAGSEPILNSGSSISFDGIETPSLPVGVYNGTYTIVSTEETAGPSFDNNTYLRTIEVTDVQGVYSQDGIGLHPQSNLASVGTNSFVNTIPFSADGSVYATMYHIKKVVELSGIRVMLDGGTVPGGQITGSLKDTSSFFAANMASLFSTSPDTISASDVAAGYIDLLFDDPVWANVGAFYAAAELMSNANLNDIRIVDDRTISQPQWASAVYLPGDPAAQYVYTNGNALGIQLLMGNWIGLSENTLSNISVYPNPSIGLITLTASNDAKHNVKVTDVLGNHISSAEFHSSLKLDLSAYGSGTYFLSISNEDSFIVKKIVLQ